MSLRMRTGSEEQMPRLAIARKKGGAGVGGQEGMVAVGDGADGDDEPGIFGNDAADEEVNFVAAVRARALAMELGRRGAELVSAVARGYPRRFDLDTAEAAAGVHDEVITGAVSEGLRDGETEIHSAGEEARFGEFAAGFGGTHTAGLLVGETGACGHGDGG